MNKKFKIVSIFIVLVILLVGCNDKSAIIGEYHNFADYDFKGMDIMPYDNMSNMKRFSRSEAQEIYDYLLTIRSEESGMLTEDNTPAKPGVNPYYIIALYFEENDYSVTVGENYILILLNDAYDSVEEVSENTRIHFVNEEIMNEFIEMINSLINDN
ncbi:MAG: hypothetical protein RBR71_05025 [Gudongella sp.]|nr:hypothetical protein [Gudongella sp.]